MQWERRPKDYPESEFGSAIEVTYTLRLLGLGTAKVKVKRAQDESQSRSHSTVPLRFGLDDANGYQWPGSVESRGQQNQKRQNTKRKVHVRTDKRPSTDCTSCTLVCASRILSTMEDISVP